MNVQPKGLPATFPAPVIVDCDPGIDDAVALALLAASPEFDLQAVTTVRGNVTVELATRNAWRTLAAFGRPEVPVCPGATRPLVRENPPYRPIHGADGIGDVELPAADGEARSAMPALAAFERVLEPAAPGSITVIALAPLTNIALLLATRPDLADRIGLLAVMGATIDRGNITPFGEFNIWADPEAAQRVLGEGELPARVFALAATRKASLDESQRLELTGWSRAGATLAEMILGYDEQVTGAGWPLHDAMVVAGLVEPGIVELREATAVEDDTTTGPHRGATTFTWGPLRQAPLEVAVDADPERFRELLRERIATLA
jgi:pyrimidine-specific ribonucleoside hydrolase